MMVYPSCMWIFVLFDNKQKMGFIHHALSVMNYPWMIFIQKFWMSELSMMICSLTMNHFGILYFLHLADDDLPISVCESLFFLTTKQKMAGFIHHIHSDELSLDNFYPDIREEWNIHGWFVYWWWINRLFDHVIFYQKQIGFTHHACLDRNYPWRP